ncbi:uncharacterized protein Nuf2 [Battus philenor]|uniref:uncharacterized protein Nuf2 n=1 Tax=Battus philenor TaxID=42288 RepID=UPI0035D12D58
MDFLLNVDSKLDSLITEEIKSLSRKIDEKIHKEKQQIQAYKMKNELESKLALEAKINAELTKQLADLERHASELERVCNGFAELTIAESDKKRLEIAKDMYQVAKELTGVRPDFSAPPNVAKGYVKNEARRLLQSFEHDATDTEALWTLIRSTATQDWPILDKENTDPN